MLWSLQWEREETLGPCRRKIRGQVGTRMGGMALNEPPDSGSSGTDDAICRNMEAMSERLWWAHRNPGRAMNRKMGSRHVFCNHHWLHLSTQFASLLRMLMGMDILVNYWNQILRKVSIKRRGSCPYKYHQYAKSVHASIKPVRSLRKVGSLYAIRTCSLCCDAFYPVRALRAHIELMAGHMSWKGRNKVLSVSDPACELPNDNWGEGWLQHWWPRLRLSERFWCRDIKMMFVSILQVSISCRAS